MSQYLSNKLSILSLICILGVLIIHTHYLEASTFTLAAYVQNIVGGQLVRFCVPLFFLISGYLFFVNINSGAFSLVWTKLRRRVSSLFVPYLICNTLFFFGIIALQLIPWTSKFVNTDFLSMLRQDIWSIITYLYWEPAAFHLWFLKYLMLFMLSTPILLLCLSNSYAATIYALCTYSIWGVFCFQDSYAQNYLFFVAGAYLAFYKVNICRKMNPATTLFAIGAYLAWCVINVHFSDLCLPQFEIPRLTLGCIAIWGMYDYFYQMAPQMVSYLLKWSIFTFFVYLFHEPWINVYKKLALRIFGVSEITLTVSYFLIPIIMYMTCVLVAICIRKYLPRTYSILTGGRV